jgi:competence protein ComFC
MAPTDSDQSLAKSVVSSFLDFLFPPVCQICERTFFGDNIWLCDICRDLLEVSEYPVCPICRSYQHQPAGTCPACGRRSNIAWLYSLGPYDERYSRLVKSVKYSPKPGLAKLLGGMLGDRLSEFSHLRNIDAVCCVPMHRSKQSKRGFNQSDILAEEVTSRLDLEYYPDELIQPRPNRDQIGLTVPERFANVRDAYAVAEDFALVDRNILLIDDVTTTGATLNAAAHTLKSAGAAIVVAATVATAIEDRLDFNSACEYLKE